MNFFKKLVIASLALITFYTNAISDNHDIVKNNTNAEEPLPLNDPFVGDSSISGGVTIITDDNITSERKKIDLYNFKLVGIIKSQGVSFVSLINQDGENINIEMFEELNDGVKLVDHTKNIQTAAELRTRQRARESAI